MVTQSETPVLVDVRERLYYPLRREAGLGVVSRADLPGHALQEAAAHMTAAINTNHSRALVQAAVTLLGAARQPRQDYGLGQAACYQLCVRTRRYH